MQFSYPSGLATINYNMCSGKREKGGVIFWLTSLSPVKSCFSLLPCISSILLLEVGFMSNSTPQNRLLR